MPVHKVTNFLSEISAFFKNNDAHKAMYSIMDVIKWLKIQKLPLGSEEPLKQCVLIATSVPNVTTVSLFYGL